MEWNIKSMLLLAASCRQPGQQGQRPTSDPSIRRVGARSGLSRSQLQNELLALVGKALESQKFARARRLRSNVAWPTRSTHSASPSMQEDAEQVARGDTTSVLIEGEKAAPVRVLRQPDPPDERAPRQAVRRDQLRCDPERVSLERASCSADEKARSLTRARRSSG